MLEKVILFSIGEKKNVMERLELDINHDLLPNKIYEVNLAKSIRSETISIEGLNPSSIRNHQFLEEFRSGKGLKSIIVSAIVLIDSEEWRFSNEILFEPNSPDWTMYLGNLISFKPKRLETF